MSTIQDSSPSLSEMSLCSHDSFTAMSSDKVSQQLALWPYLLEPQLSTLSAALQNRHITTFTPFDLHHLYDIAQADPANAGVLSVQRVALQLFQHIPTESLNYSFHGILIDLGVALGYEIHDKGGVCYGITVMTLIEITHGRRDRLQSLLKDLMKLVHENNYDMPQVVAALNKNHYLRFQCQALLDGIMICNDKGKYQEYFLPEDRSKRQSFSPEVEALFVNTADLQVERAHNRFSGYYSVEEIQHTFRLLKEAAKASKAPLNMMVLNLSHVLGVFYDPIHDQWRFIDANNLPIQEVPDEEYLAKLICDGFHFSKSGPNAFSIEVFSSKTSHKELSRELTQLEASPQWKELCCFENHPARLVYAVENREMEVIDTIQKQRGCDTCDLDTGLTPLMLAGIHDHADLIPRLIMGGAQPNLRDRQGKTALFIAVAYDSLNTAKGLLAEKVNPDLPDALGNTPLMIAAKNDSIESVNMLIEAGAKIDLQNKKGCTALQRAAEKNHLRSVQALIQAGAKLDLSDHVGNTPLMIAAREGNLEVVNMLIDAGAKINQFNSRGFSALFFAIGAGDSNIVQRLLDSKASLSIQAHRGVTPIIFAITCVQSQIVTELCRREDVAQWIDVQDQQGYTALMFAAGKKDVRSVQALIQAGAKKELKNQKGETAHTIALSSESPEIIQLLS